MMDSRKFDISFSGAGFMGCYYFGVVDCLNKYISRERINRVAGTSAGSLIAAYYLMQLPLEDCLHEIISMTEAIRARTLGVFDRKHQIVDMLPEALDRMFPEDAHKQCSGRLFVCMTRLKDMKKVMVSEFASKQELIEALNCSCFIPVWSGNHSSVYKGVKHIDGGFSDNLPVFDDYTIRVCCFAGASDISPMDRMRGKPVSHTVLNMPFYLNMANVRRMRRALVPPPASYMLELLLRGFHDTKHFVLDRDLIQCESCFQRSDPRARPRSACISPAISRAASQPDLSEAGGPAEVAGSRKAAAHPLAQQLLLAVPGRPATPSRLAGASPSPSFGRELHLRLEQASCLDERMLARAAPPSIVLDDADCSSSDSGCQSSGDASPPDPLLYGGAAGPPRLAPEAPASPQPRRWRKQAAQLRPLQPAQTGAGAAQQQSDSAESFRLAPEPLPCCPPSPALNRHCNECLRLRQEARADQLQEAIRTLVARYMPAARTATPLRRVRRKLGSPLRWLRQLNVRSSYSMAAAEAC